LKAAGHPLFLFIKGEICTRPGKPAQSAHAIDVFDNSALWRVLKVEARGARRSRMSERRGFAVGLYLPK
jgi:hypothetical protein